MPEIRAVDLSTEALAPEDQLEAWQDVLSRALYPVTLRPRPGDDGGYRARFRAVRAGGSSVTVGVSDGVRVDLSPSTARNVGGQHLELTVQTGPRRITTATDRIEVPSGRLVAHIGDVPTRHEHRGDDRAMLIAVPWHRVATARAHLARIRLRPLPLAPVASRVLEHAATDVLSGSGLDAGAAEDYLVSAVELALRATVGDPLDRDETGPARRRHALDVMAEHLHDATLDATAVATRLGMSRRRLYTLFEGGPGVAETLRALRVERAEEILRDPARRDWSIRRVAHAVGFADRSSFSRAFQDRTGRRPSELRNR